MNDTKKIRLELFVASVVLLFCECVFFRNVIGSDALIGDRGDGRLTTLLTEHWWKFFTGREAFDEIGMFYPYENVIGYTDLFLGYGIIHSIFRLVGIGMFTSYKYTLVVVHVMGTISSYYLLRYKLRCSTIWSLFGTIAFSFSNCLSIHIGHTQLAAIAWLPILFILFMGFIENYDIRYKRNIYGYCMVVWFALITYNSWYIACFTGVFVLIVCGVSCFVYKNIFAQILKTVQTRILPHIFDYLGYAVCLIILYIPFLNIYLPVMKQSGGYSYGSIYVYMPEFADLLNVGYGNLLFGKTRMISKLAERGYSVEVYMGFSFVLLLLFIWMTYVSIKKKDTILQIILISVATGIVLTTRLSANGISFWWIIQKILPIVRSTRAIGRFWLWLSFPMAIATAVVADKYYRATNIKKVLASVIILCVLFVSNVTTSGVSSSWKAVEETEFVSSVEVPPNDIEAFYIVDSDKTGDPRYIYHLDAFEIATWYDTKTINGYSGQLPQDYGNVNEPSSDLYLTDVNSWIERYELDNVYAYDRATNTWIKHEEYSSN